MAAGPASHPTTTTTTVNGTSSSPSKPLQLAIDLPRSPGLKLNLHLTILANSILLFLTSTTSDTTSSSSSAVQMGSFIYALPDRYNPSQPLSTALYTATSSQDFTTRMAKVLAKKLGKPCYVSSSVNLSGVVGGGPVEEEMEAFRVVVETVVKAANGER
ncbi:hypothetical protein CERZMDRAFT_91420 [Cercospora zeae-maydis SCOH1-5]|uniref:Proteasome assembly chaperone 3 n=1 Tax=Cercospora zeae-maydis SCOH1-5 TaxID=717836 RepID=A0A6A6F425_9PEZI|nr:hypothetical protein CERZMDRAFT_91420 [Cercospora zeae-maydis SCOH1-5]